MYEDDVLTKCLHFTDDTSRFFNVMVPEIAKDFEEENKADVIPSRVHLESYIRRNTMADDIELNFAVPATGVVRQIAPKKGGRWTDR